MSARETFNGMLEELRGDFDLIPKMVSTETSPAALADIIHEEKPQAIVLMNNPTLRTFRQYQVIAPPAQKNIPAIAVLTSFLRETGRGIHNLTGVIYEVPLVTSLVNLRALVEQPIQKIGVLYRPIFESFLLEQRKLCSNEGFQLIGVPVRGHDPSEIRDSLRTLRKRIEVDAIWVLNDNQLLQRKHLLNGWLPALKGNRTPIVVNVRSLVSKEVSFGTFAVLPDHEALGNQAAQLIASIANKDWVLSQPGKFEYPITVEKVLDLKFARKNLLLKEQQLTNIDQLIE